jgi:hypothetical protein
MLLESRASAMIVWSKQSSQAPFSQFHAPQCWDFHTPERQSSSTFRTAVSYMFSCQCKRMGYLRLLETFRKCSRLKLFVQFLDGYLSEKIGQNKLCEQKHSYSSQKMRQFTSFRLYIPSAPSQTAVFIYSAVISGILKRVWIFLVHSVA